MGSLESLYRMYKIKIIRTRRCRCGGSKKPMGTHTRSRILTSSGALSTRHMLTLRRYKSKVPLKFICRPPITMSPSATSPTPLLPVQHLLQLRTVPTCILPLFPVQQLILSRGMYYPASCLMQKWLTYLFLKQLQRREQLGPDFKMERVITDPRWSCTDNESDMDRPRSLCLGWHPDRV
jgi:hypothetical protein